MKKITSLLIVLTLIISSCQKDIVFVDGSGPGNGKTPKNGGGSSNALSGTTWRLVASTSIIEYDQDTFSVDLYAMLPSCQIDNLVTYNANFTATSDEGPTKCDPSTPQSQTGGKWTLSSDKKTLITEFPLYLGMTSITAEVLQLDNDFFKIRYITTVDGPKATTTTTYARVR